MIHPASTDHFLKLLLFNTRQHILWEHLKTLTHGGHLHCSQVRVYNDEVQDESSVLHVNLVNHNGLEFGGLRLVSITPCNVETFGCELR